MKYGSKKLTVNHLQGATLNLDNAFTRFFREKKGFPHFKSKKNRVQSFNAPQNYKVDFNNNKIYLPKIGGVKTKLHREWYGKTLLQIGQFEPST
ncbi:hypothetical protein [Methanobacterium spitsbergense]|uniref:Transposase n=1 Tax=Methanobacterium spitsbergense TaxID=2874285 RepID=A0A8T5UQS3_9EURY|nr:hypothetical protein [Methanobacterium spitsbergense]MBZ2166332.1 hypothetical protein [Methanobacterium spitsbergense]